MIQQTHTIHAIKQIYGKQQVIIFTGVSFSYAECKYKEMSKM